LHIKKDARAVTTLVTILLVLVSAVFGAAISYMWVMASFYNMPENMTLAVVENMVFPKDDFTYFNVTLLNPSNSVSDINVTALILIVESRNEPEYISVTDPQLSFLIAIGTRQTFKCTRNWSNIAGETVRIEPVAADASIKSYSYTTPKAKLEILDFNASESVLHFDLTLENSPDSVTNLTLSSIVVADLEIRTSPSLPLTTGLAPGQNETFRCYHNWEEEIGGNITITMMTTEGFEQEYTTTELLGAHVFIRSIDFDDTDTSYLNVTLMNAEGSTVTAMLDKLTLTFSDNTTLIPDTSPPFGIISPVIPPNESITIKCFWNWSDHRSEVIRVDVSTKQNFTVTELARATPSVVVWKLDTVGFDLDDLEHFSVNVTNTLVSLQAVNVTEIDFNENSTIINSTLVEPGGQVTVDCGFNWTSFVGQNAAITVYITYGPNATSSQYTLQLPYIKILNVSFSNFPTGNPYVNVTIFHSQFSKLSANITKVLVKTDNETFSVDGTLMSPKIGPEGYNLIAGTEITVVCPWDWSPYTGKEVTVIMQTADGNQVSMTSKVE
jgi:hypothetical protein